MIGAYPDIERYDTFPKLLRYNAESRAALPAIREKDLGIWQTWTWAEVRDEVRPLACGLAELGLKRGERIAIIGDNRPRLYWAIAAAQCIGAIPVPVYQDAVAAEMRYVLDHAEVALAIAENQEQVDKVLGIAGALPALRGIVFDDPRGLRDYDRATLWSFEDIQARGRAHTEREPGFFDAEIDKGSADDESIILYTSGTTGNPKGVVLTYRNVITCADAAIRLEGLTESEDVLAYLPMAWVGDHMLSYGQSYVAGFCMSCPESPDTVLTDLRELGPTYFFAPPRIFETIITTVMIRMEDAGALKQRLFRYFIEHARLVGSDLLDGKPVGLGNRLLYRMGEALIYAPLKNVLGLSRVRVAYTAGEAIGPEIFQFYRSLGINLKQLYGQTEASVFVTIQPNGEVIPDTVGKPAPGVEIRIAENGEVLYRSPGVFKEYFKNPEATRSTKDAEGWVLSGDAGIIDDAGHLRIIDRAKDVGRLDDGALFAPKYIENKLKFFPSIKEVVAFGHERPFVAVMINVDYEAMSNWAERNNIAFASYRELAARSEVYAMIEGHVREVNEDLARDPRLAGSRIRRFVLLHKLLDADDGELTRTQKVRRSFIAERYQPIVEALYSGQATCHIDTEVTFEDGRKGRIAADLEIRDIAPEPATIAHAAE